MGNILFSQFHRNKFAVAMVREKSDSRKDRKEKEEDEDAGESSEDEYVVEKIVGRRIKGGRVST